MNFLTLHLIFLKNKFKRSFCSSPLKVLYWGIGVIFSFWLVYLGVYKGLNFLISLGGLGVVIIKRLIFVLFFIVFFMVAISAGVLFYNIAFRSRETEFLFTLPLETEKILNYSFWRSFVLASWIPFWSIFVFFSAYAKLAKLPFFLSFWLLLYLLPFLIISSFVGCSVTMFLMHPLFYRKRKKILLVLVVIGILFIFFTIKKGNPSTPLYLLSEEIVFFRLSQSKLFPFSWPVYGVSYLEEKDVLHSFIYLFVIYSLCAFLISLVSFPVSYYRKIYQRRYLGSIRRIKKINFLNIFAKKMPSAMQAFAIKDLKIFLREPTFLLQFFVFFGILFFYFLNLRKFSYHLLKDVWKNVLAFLNTFSILCIVSALSIRFVFPQWSLEGRNFWIVKLSPVSIRKVFWEKFLLSLLLILPVATFLITLSNFMLKVEGYLFLVTLLLVLISCVVLILLSLGLGAFFADFKEEYYLKAVESVGGFITLIINFVYVLATIFLFGILSHLYISGEIKNPLLFFSSGFLLWTGIFIFLSYKIGTLGVKKISQKEY